MDKGENSSVPQNSNFSSPNTASNTPQPLVSPAAPATAAMPENDMPQAVSSAPITGVANPSRSRFGLSRRFNAQAPQQPVTPFAAAPAYFNQAVASNYADSAKPKSKVKLIIIGSLAAVIVIVACVIAFTAIRAGKLASEGREIAAKMDDTAIEDVLYLEDAFTRIASVSKEGRENISNMFMNETYANYVTKIENVSKMSMSINELNADKYSGEYKETLKTVQSKLTEATKKYNDYLSHYTKNYEYIAKGKTGGESDSSIPELARQYTIYKTAKQQIGSNHCMAQTTFSALCRSLIDQRKSADKYMDEAEIADVFGGRSKVASFVKVHAELNALRELIIKNGGDAK